MKNWSFHLYLNIKFTVIFFSPTNAEKKGQIKYSESHFMGSLWNTDELILITDQ